MKTTFGIIFSLIITDNSYSISMKTWTRKKEKNVYTNIKTTFGIILLVYLTDDN